MMEWILARRDARLKDGGVFFVMETAGRSEKQKTNGMEHEELQRHRPIGPIGTMTSAGTDGGA